MNWLKVGAGNTATGHTGPANAAPDGRTTSGNVRWAIGLAGALVLFVPLLLLTVISYERPRLERDALTSLEITARLKAQLIESWLGERRSDGKVLIADAEIIERIATLRGETDAGQMAPVRERLENIRASMGYPAARLLDPQGRVLLTLGAAHEFSPRSTTLVPQALASGEVMQSDVFLDPFDDLPAIDFVVPLHRSGTNGRVDVGALLLHAEPGASAFALILGWPTGSPSGETLVVRGENESVVFLNELRHVKHSAMKLRRPLSDPRLPAAAAARSGQPGTLLGVDYRGKEVLAAHRPVAGTDWHVVAKLDYDEVMEPLWDQLLWVGLAAAAAILAIGTALRLLWGQQRRTHWLAEQNRQALSLRESEARFRAVTITSRDAIVTADAEGNIVGWNPAAERMFGFRESEISGQPLKRIIPLRFHARAMAGFSRMLDGDPEHKDGSVAELVGRRQDSSEFILERSVSLWKTQAGRFYTCTMRDITERKQALFALQESEAWFRGVFESANISIASTDRNGQVGKFNEAFRAMLGYDAESLQRMNFADFTHPEDLMVEGTLFEELLVRKRSHYRLTKRYITCDQRILWVDISVSVILDTQGEVSNLIGVIHDITERIEQDASTQQLLALHETILDNALVGIVYLRQRRVVSCNRRFEELFQYDAGELVGQSSELFYATRESFSSIGERAYAVLGEAGSFSEEVVLKHKDGSSFWGALNGRAIDPAQPHEGSIWVYADISERRHAEQETGKLLQAIEQSPVSIVITNRAGVIEYVNPSFTRISGYTSGEAVGLTPAILKTETTSRATHEELWSTILAGKVWQGTLRNRCKSGDLIWEQTSISPILDHAGEITHFIAVKEDVTARKRIEQQLEEHQAHLEELVLQRTAELSQALDAARVADRAKDEFLANITHELRTPLSAVIGFSGLARPLSNDPRQRDYLDKVNSAGKTLAGIIDDLLDLSKIAAGRLEFETRPFSLRQLVERCRSVIGFKAQEKGLELVEQIAGDVPDVLVGDSLRVEQIILNLLSNAVKFTVAGRVELRVGLVSRSDQRVCLNIEVEDTGIGINADGIARLFKPFAQADASMTRKYGGTGLGLAICRRLAEMMDGDIDVSSQEGSGSTFRARLCLALGDVTDLPPEVSAPESPRIRYSGARVLVVDDQPFNRDVVEGLLAAVGITPIVAENGRQALEVLAGGEAFDLVLMDIQMPVMDGLSATRAIRAMNGLDSLPIVAMTAHTMAHEREKSVAAGLNDHIGKPFDETGFYRVLAKWISLHKQRLQDAGSPAPRPAGALPDLPGVDVRAGLALLQGDEARYRKWMGLFVAEMPATMLQIRQSLAAGKSDVASMAAHTLKGRTGLLGMGNLHAIAAALETAIDSGTPTAELLLALEGNAAAMCIEIRNRLGADDSAPATATAVPERRPDGPPPASVALLIEGLQAGDSDSDSLAERCLTELAGTPWESHLRLALNHIARFDYVAAAGLLAEARQEIPEEV